MAGRDREGSSWIDLLVSLTLAAALGFNTMVAVGTDFRSSQC